MGRRPKKMEEMMAELHALLWRMCAIRMGEVHTIDKTKFVNNPLNVLSIHYDNTNGEGDTFDRAKKARYDGYRYETIAKMLLSYSEKLQNDFTPDERRTVLRMFRKN